MNPKYRALIWEQLRVAGVLALWCAAVSALIIAFIWSQYYLFPGIQRPDALSASLLIYFATAMAFAALLVLRQDSTGQMRPGFEARHARLPINTLPLVTVQAATRLTCLLLLCGALLTLHGALYGETPSAFYVFIPVTIYLFAQTLSWCHHAMPGIAYMTGIILFLIPALLAAMGNYRSGYFSALAVMAQSFGHLAVVLLLLPAAYALSLLGVHWTRRDEQHGLFTGRELADGLAGLGASPAKAFRSPLAAQAWYEWRRMGWIIPLFTFSIILMAAVILFSLPNAQHFASVWAQYLPLATMPLAALCAALISYRGRSDYARLRPAAIPVFSSAKFLALGRSLTWTALLVSGLSIGGFFFFGDTETALLREALRHGETNYIEITAMLLAPCLLSALIASAIVFGGYHFIALALWQLNLDLYWFWLAGIIGFVGASLLWAAWRGWMARTGLAASFLFWAALSGALLLIFKDSYGVNVHTLATSIAFAGYVAVIPAALPFAVYMRRRAR